MSNSDKDESANPPVVQGEVAVDATVEDDGPANKSAEEGTAHPKKKRRRQDAQLTKDDDPEASHNSDDELNEEGEERSDLSKRVKVSRNVESIAASANEGGTLASVKLAAAASSEKPPASNDGEETTKSILFGSSAKSAVSFGSLSGAAPGFGSLASSGTSFGAGFGAATGFGAVSNASFDNADGVGKPKTFGSSSAGFGSVAAAASSGGSSGFATFVQEKPKDESPKIFEQEVDTNNGEENETCICQVRAKLYKMVWVQEKRADEGRSADKTPSVPSTKGRLGDLNKAKADDNDNNGADNVDKECQPKGKLVQKEAGGCIFGFTRVLLFTTYLNTDMSQGKVRCEF